MNFAKNLRFLRQRDGYTQRYLANYLNIDRSSYSYYEIGRSEPKLAKLQRLAALFGVTIDEMVNCDMAKDPRFEKKPRDRSAADDQIL